MSKEIAVLISRRTNGGSKATAGDSENQGKRLKFLGKNLILPRWSSHKLTAEGRHLTWNTRVEIRKGYILGEVNTIR